MPNRIIREGFLDSEAVQSLSDWAERVYHRLLIAADDAGRADGRAEMLRARLLPLDSSRRSRDVAEALRQIAEVNLVLLYEVDGKPFVQATKWQRCSQAKLSKFPARDGSFEITFVTLPTRDGPKDFVASSIVEGTPGGITGGRPLSPSAMPLPGGGAKPSGRDREGIPKGSGRDLAATASQRTETKTETDTETDTKTGEHEGGSRPPDPPVCASGSRSKRDRTPDPGFDAFWAAYPKRSGRLDAEKAWAKLTPEEREKALELARVYAEAKRGVEPKFVKDPSGWLNGKRFNDDPATWVREGAPRPLVGAHPPGPRPKPGAPAEELEPPPPGGGVWPRVLEALQPLVDERDFDTWFRGTRQVGELNGALRVAVASSLFADYVPREYGPAIERACRACGVEAPVEFVTEGAEVLA